MTANGPSAERQVLVLDDVHEVRNPAVLNGITEMLRHPSPVRLVLLSRSDPDLPLPGSPSKVS